MTRGCSKNDYNVSVGGGVCNVTALTDTVLTCTPPVEKPPVNDDTFKYCPLHSSHLAVMVRLLVSSDNPVHELYLIKTASTVGPIAHF